MLEHFPNILMCEEKATHDTFLLEVPFKLYNLSVRHVWQSAVCLWVNLDHGCHRVSVFCVI